MTARTHFSFLTTALFRDARAEGSEVAFVVLENCVVQ